MVKLMLKTSFLVIVFALFHSCESKPVQENVTVPKTTVKSSETKAPDTEKKNFWGYAKESVPMTQSEIRKVRSIIKRYNAKTKALKASGKWAGDANKATRSETNIAQKQEIQKIIGKNKYNLYLKAKREWNSKS